MSPTDEGRPRLRRVLTIALTTTMLAGGAAVIWAAGEKTQKTRAGKVVHISSDAAEYEELFSGVSKAKLWGDPDKGAYGTFTKFEPGQRNEMHTHSNDVRMVVLRGAYIYEPEGGEAIKAKAGDYILVPAGVRHVSSGDPSEGALFFETASAKFDFKPMKPR